MDYTALYRKFRPKTFDELVGQDHITKTIKNQIVSDRVGHAYLFSGGRGTGKTSAAKILARTINCLNPQNGEPCNECEMCKAAFSGSLTDIVEMDAASNNSVEDVRSIREEVNFLPTLAKYRVYIIDEVHMLSTGAFNALLKTLEEPPSHVKFILATTEPQKLPATILSRCQRFDFKRISNDDIIKRLKIIATEAKIDITDQALNIIANLSEGAMRDALSILERCLQDGENQISEDKVKELVGIPKLENISDLVKAMLNYNVEDTLNTLDIIVKDGKDLNNLIWEIIKYTKDILLYKTSKITELYSEQEIKKIEELSEIVTKERLLEMIYSLSEIENNIKWSSQKLIMLQTGLIKLCNKQNSQDITELVDRINKLEEKLQNNNIKPVINTQNEVVEKPKEKVEVKKEKKSIISKSEDFWEDILVTLKQNGKLILYTNLVNSKAKIINDKIFGIEFPNGLTAFGKTILEKSENIKELEKLVEQYSGKQMSIKYLDGTENFAKVDESNELDISINIID